MILFHYKCGYCCKIFLNNFFKGVLKIKLDVLDSHDESNPLTIADFDEEKSIEAHSFEDAASQTVSLIKEIKSRRGDDFSKSISFKIRYCPDYEKNWKNKNQSV